MSATDYKKGTCKRMYLLVRMTYGRASPLLHVICPAVDSWKKDGLESSGRSKWT